MHRCLFCHYSLSGSAFESVTEIAVEMRRMDVRVAAAGHETTPSAGMKRINYYQSVGHNTAKVENDDEDEDGKEADGCYYCS